MSDIEFLSIKEFDGKRVDVDADTTTTNDGSLTDCATQTASGGKDMYLGSASFIHTITSGTAFDEFVSLVVNGVVVETVTIFTSGPDSEFIYTFKTKGVKVSAGQIIKITILANVLAITDTKSKLILWEENTNETPQIASI